MERHLSPPRFHQTYGAEGLFRNRLKVLQEQQLRTDDVSYHIHRGGAVLSVSSP